MTPQEKDRIECAIRHIQTAVDVDPWAAEIAVDAMEKLIPKKLKIDQSKFNNNLWYLYCPSCENYIGTRNGRLKRNNNNVCPYCGQAIDWEEE